MKLPTILSLAALPCALATTFNGDKVNGVPVITDLDVNNLQANRIHKFYLQASQLNSGHPVFVPVIVARGPGAASSGKTVWLSGTIHGDELNPVRVVQKVFQYLDVSKVNGTIIGIPGVNVLGIQGNTRYYTAAYSSGTRVDLNRLFPGNPEGAVPNRYDAAIWYGLTKNGTQIDAAIDMHTPSSGSDTPLWAYCDYAAPGVQDLCELIGADIIKVDPGEPGSLETTFVEYGVPALTLEIGKPKEWQPVLIKRSYDFVLRALASYQVLPASAAPALPSVDTYAGTTFEGVSADFGGWFESFVKPNDDVTEGQLVGYLYDTFGGRLQNVTSPATGRVHTVRYDPASEPGVGLVTVITDRQ